MQKIKLHTAEGRSLLEWAKRWWLTHRCDCIEIDIFFCIYIFGDGKNNRLVHLENLKRKFCV